MELSIGGIFAYLFFLGVMVGTAAGLLFALRAVK
jgi:hypothetical protein